MGSISSRVVDFSSWFILSINFKFNIYTFNNHYESRCKINGSRRLWTHFLVQRDLNLPFPCITHKIKWSLKRPLFGLICSINQVCQVFLIFYKTSDSNILVDFFLTKISAVNNLLLLLLLSSSSLLFSNVNSGHFTCFTNSQRESVLWFFSSHMEMKLWLMSPRAVWIKNK
jgi:hypothetical protein